MRIALFRGFMGCIPLVFSAWTLSTDKQNPATNPN